MGLSLGQPSFAHRSKVLSFSSIILCHWFCFRAFIALHPDHTNPWISIIPAAPVIIVLCQIIWLHNRGAI